jgi:hypothetical protein
MAPFLDLYLNIAKITNGAKGASIKTWPPFILIIYFY